MNNPKPKFFDISVVTRPTDRAACLQLGRDERVPQEHIDAILNLFEDDETSNDPLHAFRREIDKIGINCQIEDRNSIILNHRGVPIAKVYCGYATIDISMPRLDRHYDSYEYYSRSKVAWEDPNCFDKIAEVILQLARTADDIRKSVH